MIDYQLQQLHSLLAELSQPGYSKRNRKWLLREALQQFDQLLRKLATLQEGLANARQDCESGDYVSAENILDTSY